MMTMWFKCLCAGLLVILMQFATAARAEDPSQWQWQDAERIVAFGDVHGAYPELVVLLQQAQVIDTDLRWQAGKTHLVSVGDLLDRGAQSRKVMDLMMRLQQESAVAGGAVHQVLGNHEIMNLTGDLRYVSVQEYASYLDLEDPVLRQTAIARFTTEAKDRGETFNQDLFDKHFPPGFFGHKAAFSPTGEYGAWLLQATPAVQVNDSLFTHGGLSPAVAEMGIGESISQSKVQLLRYIELWQQLTDAGLVRNETGFWERFELLGSSDNTAQLSAELEPVVEEFLSMEESLVSDGDSLAWYRGNAMCHPATESEAVEKVLASIGASRVVIAHTPTPMRRITTRMGGKVISIDTGMLASVYKGRPSALIVEADALSTIYAGEEGAFEPVDGSDRIAGQAVSDAELEDFLLTAEVIKQEKLSTGGTKPMRLTLEKDGVQLRVMYKNYDKVPDLLRRSVIERKDYQTDRYQHEVAAYKLDRILGLNRVPVSVIRTYKKKRGVFQYWIPNTISEGERREKELAITGECSVNDQYQLRFMYDILIYNVDRNLGNLLYDEDSWTLWFIDHSQAFAIGRNKYRERPKMYAKVDVHITPWMRRKLGALTQENLEEQLGTWLHPTQIREMLWRRDKLLDN
ncbi:MAG: metallophosphoesterase [Pseudomonadales bacterium]